MKVLPLYFYRPQQSQIPTYCSPACVHASQRKEKVTLTCKICSKEWLDFPSKANYRVTCSVACYRQLQRQMYAGHGNPNWQGGMKQIRLMIHNSTIYDHFRADVLNRAGFCCERCGTPAAKKRRTGDLEVHHIVTVESLLDKIFDPDNGIAICPDCHIAEHKSCPS